MRVFIGLAILFFYALMSCNNNIGHSNANYKTHGSKEVTELSFSELSRNYKKFHNQVVETEGMFYYEFENVAICAEKGLFSNEVNCFWLGWNTDFFKQVDNNNKIAFDEPALLKMTGKKVKIRGVIDTMGKGHLNSYLATIKDTYILEPH